MKPDFLDGLGVSENERYLDLVDRPQNATTLHWKWVLSRRLYVDGHINRYLAWLVTCGSAHDGVIAHIFAPVSDFNIERLIRAVVEQMAWLMSEIH